MKHVKGILIAIASATILLFVISFFVSSQLNASTDAIVNVPKEKLIDFLANPANMQKWMGNVQEFEAEIKDDHILQYIGYDQNLHQFNFLKAKDGVEIRYSKNSEPLGVFTLFVKNNGDQSTLTYTQAWDMGGNPLKKILSRTAEDDLIEGMKKDIMKLKAKIED